MPVGQCRARGVHRQVDQDAPPAPGTPGFRVGDAGAVESVTDLVVPGDQPQPVQRPASSPQFGERVQAADARERPLRPPRGVSAPGWGVSAPGRAMRDVGW